MERRQNDDHFSCGVDEAGRGPVIGPLVVSIVCGDEDLLHSIGARDSKALSRKTRENLDRMIRERADFVYWKEISADELNKLMDRINLNEIEEDAYAEVISKIPFECTVYVDSFDVNEQRLSQKLSGRTGKNIVCEHKADARFPAVSAASIISKVLRDNAIDKMEKTYGKIGSGYPSDPVTVNFLVRSINGGVDITNIARTHWKTYQNIISRKKNRKLF